MDSPHLSRWFCNLSRTNDLLETKPLRTFFVTMMTMTNLFRTATKEKRERWIRLVFVVTVVWKGVDGLFEALLGLALLFTGTTMKLLFAFTHNELLEDPTDTIARLIQQTAPRLLARASLFAGCYLLGYGLVKLFLMYGLLRDRLWVYRTSLYMLSVFFVYQAYRIARYHSAMLAVFTLFDLVLLWLVYHEYQLCRHRQS
jgi:uncharacterized membrane protein